MIKYVKDIWEDSDGFIVVLSNGIWTTWYHVAFQDLDNGGSLSRIFTFKNRKTLSRTGWGIDRDSLLEATKEAIKKLRPIVDDYFFRRDLENNETKSDSDM